MRWSQFTSHSSRGPADAYAVSHRLLLRAGFIRQLMAGHYSLLPLGVKVRTKIIAIIREEMNRIGAQEFLLPSMQPGHIWEKSGRIDVMGEEMFKFRDRRGQLTVLGMTHEEIFATLAIELASYRQPAAVLVPVPDEVQGRAPAQERPDPGPRVHDERQLQLRHRRGRARCLFRRAPAGLRADLRQARHPGLRGAGLQRHHGRLGLRRVHVSLSGRRGLGS